MPAKPLIKLENVWKIYNLGKRELNVLRNINLEIQKGDFAVILGPSGSGKSNLLNIIGCLDLPTKGRVFLEGRDISELSEDELAEIRAQKIGFVFQQFNLLQNLTSLENVMMPMIFRGIFKENSEEKRREKSVKTLNSLGLKERINHRPFELSGGEQQRTAIARALVNNPEIIVADEPIGNLDSVTGKKMIIVGILRSLASKQDDSMIALDLSIFQQITGERNGYQGALAKVESEFSTEQAAENIKENLSEIRKRKRGEEGAPFSVLTSEKVTEIVGNILTILQLVIFGFASIAIIVGGIGIMNTMYTSVRERIKEIGILKAVGAKNSAISAIFLIEAGIVGFIGGIGGVFLGLLFAKIVEFYFQLHPLFYFKASLSPLLIVFSLFFSFGVGCLSGFLPARKAAKLKPVEALRYE